jgi:hypothetical protein
MHYLPVLPAGQHQSFVSSSSLCWLLSLFSLAPSASATVDAARSSQWSVGWLQRRSEEGSPPLSREGAGGFCCAAVAAAA